MVTLTTIELGPAAVVTTFTHTEYIVNLSKSEMFTDGDETVKNISIGDDIVSDDFR